MAPRVYRLVLRLCGDPERANDLAQEALTRGWQSRNQLRSADALPTWLFRIALRTWHDGLRRDQRILQSDSNVEGVPAQDSEPIEITIGNELGAHIWKEMETLPDRQKQVLHLRVIEQLEISEIAEVVGIRPQNVRSNLAAARKKLRESLKSMNAIQRVTE